MVCLDDDDRFKENILETYFQVIEESKEPIDLIEDYLIEVHNCDNFGSLIQNQNSNYNK